MAPPTHSIILSELCMKPHVHPISTNAKWKEIYNETILLAHADGNEHLMNQIVVHFEVLQSEHEETFRLKVLSHEHYT
jgi:hypothetical protein